MSSGAPPPSSDPTKLIFAPGSQADQYTKGELTESQLNPDPFEQFHTWFAHAQKEGIPHAEATTLSTAELPSGRISARVVYLKELDHRGFVVYSNWGTSRKAADVATNPRAALTFWWQELERQVRVEGPVERLSAAESQPYFDTRARGSRIGAWASRQSTPIADRAQLDAWVAEAERRFDGQEAIPVPEFWGGMRILPESMEFWQGRESRLHDRFQYERDNFTESWTLRRLSP
jgi:pyridoxamine 5'-phosphate oxidase